MHGGAAHDDALVPNIDDIPGEQGYVQMGHMHTLCTVSAERWARDGPPMGQKTRNGVIWYDMRPYRRVQSRRRESSGESTVLVWVQG